MEYSMTHPFYGLDARQIDTVTDFFDSGEADTYRQEVGCHEESDPMIIGFSSLCRVVRIPEVQIRTVLEHLQQEKQLY